MKKIAIGELTTARFFTVPAATLVSGPSASCTPYSATLEIAMLKELS